MTVSYRKFISPHFQSVWENSKGKRVSVISARHGMMCCNAACSKRLLKSSSGWVAASPTFGELFFLTFGPSSVDSRLSALNEGIVRPRNTGPAKAPHQSTQAVMTTCILPSRVFVPVSVKTGYQSVSWDARGARRESAALLA